VSIKVGKFIKKDKVPKGEGGDLNGFPETLLGLGVFIQLKRLCCLIGYSNQTLGMYFLLLLCVCVCVCVCVYAWY
jgi:hypothetical protein